MSSPHSICCCLFVSGQKKPPPLVLCNALCSQPSLIFIPQQLCVVRHLGPLHLTAFLKRGIIFWNSVKTGHGAIFWAEIHRPKVPLSDNVPCKPLCGGTDLGLPRLLQRQIVIEVSAGASVVFIQCKYMFK